MVAYLVSGCGRTRYNEFLMPPRYAYWTILIDNKPTAFRAREKEELLPTLRQLRRTNKDVVMKWFARGRLWENREDEHQSWQRGKAPVGTALRGREWRPGGQHRDPRDRFKKKDRHERAWSEFRPHGADSGSTIRRDRDKLGIPPESRPWRDKPPGTPPGSDRPWSNKPPGSASHGDRPWRNKPSGSALHGDRRWSNKPGGQARGAFRPRNERTQPPKFTPDRRESDAPPKPATDPRPGPPPRPAPLVRKPEPPERG